MSNFAYSKQVMSRSRPSKKSKSTINNVSVGLWRHVEEDDEMLPDKEMDFDIWSKLKDDICGVIKVNKSQQWSSKWRRWWLDGYQSDSYDYWLLLDEHLINIMSYMFGGKMFKEDMKSIEFRKGVMFNNFIECAWALKNLCIQKSFRVGRSSLREIWFCVDVIQTSAHLWYIQHLRTMKSTFIFGLWIICTLVKALMTILR